MANKRDTYRYHFTVLNTIIEMGITDDIQRREIELLEVYPRERGSHAFIEQVGFKPVTRAEAEEWLEQMRKAGMPVKDEILA